MDIISVEHLYKGLICFPFYILYMQNNNLVWSVHIDLIRENMKMYKIIFLMTNEN